MVRTLDPDRGARRRRRSGVLAVVCLLAAVLAPGLLLGSAAPATASGAARCTTQPVASQTRSAEAVFAGTVLSSTATPLSDGRTGESFAQQVQVSTVFKGRVDTTEVTVVTERVRRECSVGALAAGTQYMFFVSADPDAESTWRAAGGGGTAPADAGLLGQVTRLLGDGRPPVAPEAESATFTSLGAEDPARLTRVAAPGAALVLLGLLGLLVTGRLARRAAR